MSSLTQRALAAAVAAAVLLLAPTAASARKPADYVGVDAQDVYQQPGAYRNSNLNEMKKARVRLIRQPFYWDQIETRPGVYNWAFTDSFVLDAAARGIRIMPVLFRTPTFYERRSGVKGYPKPPADNRTMARFASAAVARYGPRGSLWSQPGVGRLRKYAIRSWQIWNEPSLIQYWAGRPNAREYVAMLRAVGPAIKRRDRRAEVVTAGIPNTFLGGAVRLNKFIGQMYKAKAQRYFDTLAVNSYAKGPGDLQTVTNRVRKQMDGFRDRKAKIWITELGWGDKGPRGHRLIVGAKGQAKRISSSFKLLHKNYRKLRLRGVVYFSWRDATPYGDKDQWGFHTGLLTLKGKRKPAYNAFVKAVKRYGR